MTVEHFDAIVVGSGFGGSVMTHRLAEAGLSVCLLERGKELPPGSFPRSPGHMKENFWDPSEGKHGMFDVWSFDGLDALASSGLGGGSLIYANVLIRKDERWFVRERGAGEGYESWPVTRADLDPHYDAVERLIGVEVYPPHLQQSTPKAREFAAAARRANLQHDFLPLAVRFSRTPGTPNGEPVRDAGENRYGVTRQTCRLCGECDIGCNYGSKNTLDLTVISAAERLGAEVRTRCEVRTIAPLDESYRVEYVVHAAENEGRRTDTGGLPLQALTCKVLVIAAGTFGSNHLLLRNRGRLRNLSARLGQRFSGNGDFLGFALEATQEGGAPRVLDPSHGPVITGGVRVPDAADPGGSGRGFYIEDAGYPPFFNWLIEAGMTATPGGVARLGRFLRQMLSLRLGLQQDHNFSGEVARVLGDCRLSLDSLPMLGMGRDVPDGGMSLDEDEYLKLVWNEAPSEAFFARMTETMQRLARALGATYRESPFFSMKRRLITVHALGGCAMAEDTAAGVVDAYGEVFGHPGLFVADGAVMPGPVGPNPSLTIAALSHRFAERAIARARGR